MSHFSYTLPWYKLKLNIRGLVFSACWKRHHIHSEKAHLKLSHVTFEHGMLSLFVILEVNLNAISIMLYAVGFTSKCIFILWYFGWKIFIIKKVIK